MITGAAINNDVWCGITTDGHHVSDEMVALATRALPVANWMIPVSDATSTIGGPGYFELYGDTNPLQGGSLVKSQRSVAGAHINLRGSVVRAVNTVGVSVGAAVRMATANPFEMMDLQPIGIAGSDVLGLEQIAGTDLGTVLIFNP